MSKTPPRTVRVGLIKAQPARWDLRANWALFRQLADRAVAEGAQLLCTPECFLDGYVRPRTPREWRRVGQSLNGPGYLARARRYARDRRVHLAFGFTETAPRGVYNAAALIDDRGTLLGCYHKTHITDKDIGAYLPGDALPVWSTALGRIGLMICADRRWPETARTLRQNGAEIILNPTYGMCHLDNEWWMRTRSYENECWLCFVHPQVAFVADPLGDLPAKLQSNRPGVLVHDLDLTRLPDEMWKQRRPDVYFR